MCTFDPDIFTLTSVTETEVTFEAKHAIWHRDAPVQTLNWFAAHFYQDSEYACFKDEFVAFNTTANFTATCVCGVAEIDLYAYSGSFHRRRDSAEIPAVCEDYCECVGRRCGWKYTVPCLDGPNPPECPAQRRLLEGKSETSTDSPTFETAMEYSESEDIAPNLHPECTSVWAYSENYSTCLGQLRDSRDGWTNRLELSSEPIGLDLHAYQDTCRDVGFSVGKLWLSHVNDQVVVNFTMMDEFEIKETNLFVGQRRRRLPRKGTSVLNEIFDPKLFPLIHTNVKLGNDTFYLDMVIKDEQVNVAAHAIVCGNFAAKEALLQAEAEAYEASLTCVGKVEVAFEDFEGHPRDESWNNARILSDPIGGGHFLMVQDATSPRMLYKEFQIPGGAKEILISLTAHAFGEWNERDRLYLVVWNTRVPIHLKHEEQHQTEDGSFVSTSDFKVAVPYAYLKPGLILHLGFEMSWGSTSRHSSAENKQYAVVDNILLLANGHICYEAMDDVSEAKGFSLPSSSNEGDINGDAHRCKSEEFPCKASQLGHVSGDEKMVQVCHYLGNQGYTTYCIPERDSDVLLFSKDGYCGPCEGGYKIIDDNDGHNHAPK